MTVDADAGTAADGNDHGGVADAYRPHEVVDGRTVFEGHVWDVRQETVQLGSADDDNTVVREFIEHPGAVAVIALDDQDRVLLINQYRHPVRHYLWEAPAGLLDIEDEHPLVAAKRELAEEAHLAADTWHVLFDVFNSPGSSSESLRCFLARDVSVPPGERYVGDGEERDMPSRWVPLDELVQACLAGDLHNPHTMNGVLAAYVGRSLGWSTLRPADSPWPQRFPDGLPPLTS